MKRGIWIAGCVLALAGTAAAADSKKVSIKGSNTFGEELGPALIAEFRKARPEVDIALEARSSGSGIAALIAGTCDIASASRSVNEDERRLAQSRKLSLRNYTIGYYGVAVLVHADNPLKDLSDRQVSDLFTGRIDNWKEIGGPDAPVNLYIRDPESGTHLGFRELAMANRPYAKTAKMLTTYAAIVDALAADPNGVGYGGMTLEHHAGLHALSINKIRPGVQSVNDGTYPYARQLHFYTIHGRETRPARDFIQFVRSRKGQRVLTDLGYTRRFGPIEVEKPLGP